MSADPAGAPLPDEGFEWAGGRSYVAFLERFHRLAEPASYLEIGTRTGDSLKAANCISIAIDPEFRLEGDVMGRKPALHLFQETSDDAFANPRLRALHLALDMAFLDGLHLFEVLLRDIINTEKLMAEGGAIFLHDTAPRNHEMTERRDQDEGRAWTGDVWKVLAILREHRPELAITHLDCDPTGLALVTGPWNANTALEDRYAAIVAHWTEITLETFGAARYYQSFPLFNCDLLIREMSARILMAERHAKGSS